MNDFSDENNKFLGINKFAIMSFENKSGSFDWADLYLDIEVKQEHSDYNRKLQIKGSFEKENGKIIGGSVLKRLYTFFEAIGCVAGLNTEGIWEDEKGDVIEDIAEYLNERFADISMPGGGPDNYPYIAYFYKEQPKKPGAKAYTNVWPKVYRFSEDNQTKLTKDIQWLKGKGYLKELSDENSSAPDMSGSGLANL